MGIGSRRRVDQGRIPSLRVGVQPQRYAAVDTPLQAFRGFAM